MHVGLGVMCCQHVLYHPITSMHVIIKQFEYKCTNAMIQKHFYDKDQIHFYDMIITVFFMYARLCTTRFANV